MTPSPGPAAPPIGGEPFPRALARRDRARIAGYRELLDLFEGRDAAPRGAGGERALRFNYARAFVEKGAAYLVSDHRPVVTAGEGPGGERRAAEAERALRELWEDNDLLRLDLDGELDTAVLGDGAFKVTWDERERRVVVSAPDVQGVHAWSLGDDVRRLWRVASSYELDAGRAGERAGRLARGPGGRAPDRVRLTEVWTADRFELWAGDERVEARANPYGAIPFVIYPNLPRPKRIWGVSDIEPLRESIAELNRALTQLSRIIELSGNPIAVLENVEASRDIAVQPARSGSCRSRRAPTCSTCCRAAACGCTPTTSIWCTARCTTSARRRASRSGTAAATARGWRCGSSSTRCSARWRASA